MHDRAPRHHLLHDRAPLHRPFEPLRWIGAYKLLKAAVAVFLGVLAVRLTHRDLGNVLVHWLVRAHLNPEGHFGQVLRRRVLKVTHRQLRFVGAWFFGYAMVTVVEGVGLMFRERWAEWLTAVTTAAFIPLECLELVHRFTLVRGAILVLNGLVVWYLIYRIREDRRKPSAPPAGREQDGRRDGEECQ